MGTHWEALEGKNRDELPADEWLMLLEGGIVQKKFGLITLAEIEYGMEVNNWGANRRDLMRRFLARFTPLLPDTETARVWARIKSHCEKKGRPITFADAWIAAAALQLNVPLVTHNASDYGAVEDLTILTAAAGM